ncbi:gliding motility-associated C-terminal domain-containing protein [Flagellimonas sp. 2504JD4-2]
MYHRSHLTQKKRKLYSVLLLFALFAVAIQVLAPHNPRPSFDGLISMNVNGPSHMTSNVELFVPAIAIIKSGATFDWGFPPAPGGCDYIEYTYTVTNESTSGEILSNVVINDIDLGLVYDADSQPFPITGDDNANFLLEPGETWLVVIFHTITEQNRIDGQFGLNPATVVANVQGQALQVSDLSHPTDVLDDGATIIDLTHCQIPSIGMIKGGTTIDIDGDFCDESIEYVIIVRNTGHLDLNEIEVTDTQILQGNIPGPLAGDDIGDDGILSPGEEWEYRILWPIDDTLIVAGTIYNQATVMAEVVNTGAQISDLSHDSDFTLDDDSPTPVDDPSCLPGATGISNISLLKTGSLADLDINGCSESILYTFIVRNEGDVDLDEITLMDEALSLNPITGPTVDVGIPGVLDVGEVWTFHATYTITLDDIAATQVSNQAWVSGEPVGFDFPVFDYSDPSDPNDDRITVTTGVENACVPGISLLKDFQLLDLNNDGCFETIEYEFTVDNTGTVDLSSVSLTDPLISDPIGSPESGDDNNDGVLDVGETWIYRIEYPITQADIDAGQVVNQATVTALDPDNIPIQDLSHPTDPTLDGDTTTSIAGTCVSESAISLLKDSQLLDLNSDGCDETIEYQFTVINTGAEDLNLVSLIDPLVGNDPIALDPSEDDLVDGVLSVGEDWVYVVQYPITQADITATQVVNQATVTAFDSGNNAVLDLSHPTDQTLDGDTTTSTVGTCVSAATIALVKDFQLLDTNTDGCDDTIEYLFTVTNTGTQDLRQVSLTDVLIGNNPIALPAGQDDNNDAVLSVGEDWVYQALYPITQADITATQVVNQATVTAVDGDNNALQDLSHATDQTLDGNTTTSTVGTCVAGPAIALLKDSQLLDLNSDGCDETIEYQFTVINTGAEDLTLVSLIDLVVSNDPIALDPSEDDLVDGVLSVGEDWVYVVQYPITQADITATQVVNQATVTAFDSGNNAVLDLSHPTDQTLDGDTTTSTVGTCVSAATIALVKDFQLLDTNTDGCDDTIEYLFTVTNTGTQDLRQVSLTDVLIGNNPIALPAGQDDNNDAVLSVGEDWVYQALYPITQANITATQVVNQATVTAVDGENNPIQDLSHPTDQTLDGNTTTSTVGTCVAGPAIALLKDSQLLDLNSDGCDETIEYQFTVINTGVEDLALVSLIDPVISNDPISLPSGQDDNNDGVLSVGEDWVYVVQYPITQNDITATQVVNQATVTAIDGSNNAVLDLSHPTDQTLDGNTTTSTVGTCVAGPSIGLIKTAQILDQDGDNCFETILYTFEVRNIGATDLVQISLSDAALFGGQPINGPIPGDDINEIGTLSVGETWRYEAFYPISQVDIDAGQVQNRAEVRAVDSSTNNIIFDLSDDNSFTEDDFTITSTAGACDAGPSISLVKGSELVDLDDDNCPDTIQYTFVVTNTGTRDLDSIEILDAVVSGNVAIDGPVPAVDENDDNILSANGEYWVYVLFYPISQEDINQGQVENQATVTAFELGTTNSVSDLSDFQSRDEDRPTITLLDNDCFNPTEPPITPTPSGDFQIYNGLTPNGDGFNDYFRIDDIENYPNNRLQVFNRWGVLVYDAEPYGMDGNLFDGSSSGRATIAFEKELPSGTYFYILSFPEENPGQESYTGYLYINRE